MDSMTLITIRFQKIVPVRMLDHFTVLFLDGLIKEGYMVRYTEIMSESGTRRYEIQLRYEGESYSLTITELKLKHVTIQLSFSLLTISLKEEFIREHDNRINKVLGSINLKEEG